MKITKDMVGKKVRGPDWSEGHYCLILGVGDRLAFCKNAYGGEFVSSLDTDDWEFYKEPPRTVKMAQAVFRNSDGSFFTPPTLFQTENDARNWLCRYCGRTLVLFPAGPWIDVPAQEESK